MHKTRVSKNLTAGFNYLYNSLRLSKAVDVFIYMEPFLRSYG